MMAVIKNNALRHLRRFHSIMKPASVEQQITSSTVKQTFHNPEVKIAKSAKNQKSDIYKLFILLYSLSPSKN